MWWDSQVFWAGVAGLVTATLSGMGALVYGRRQSRPAIAFATLPAAVEDLGERLDGFGEALADDIKDMNGDLARIGDEIVSRLAELDHQTTANARALSELRGMLNAMMMARGR
jgi:hypothetical protein